MGLITDSKDPKIIAKMLNSLISDQGNLSRISEYNYKYARDNFTVDKQWKGLNIYIPSYERSNILNWTSAQK